MTGFVNKIIDTPLKKRDTLFREEGLKMRTQKYNLQGIKVFFYILMIAILGWFLCMQFLVQMNKEMMFNPIPSLYRNFLLGKRRWFQAKNKSSRKL